MYVNAVVLSKQDNVTFPHWLLPLKASPSTFEGRESSLTMCHAKVGAAAGEKTGRGFLGVGGGEIVQGTLHMASSTFFLLLLSP